MATVKGLCRQSTNINSKPNTSRVAGVLAEIAGVALHSIVAALVLKTVHALRPVHATGPQV